MSYLPNGNFSFSFQAYYLMQSPETKVIGDALGFGSAFLFSAVFGTHHLINVDKPFSQFSTLLTSYIESKFD